MIIDLSFAKIQRELKRDWKKTIRDGVAPAYKLLTLLYHAYAALTAYTVAYKPTYIVFMVRAAAHNRLLEQMG